MIAANQGSTISKKEIRWVVLNVSVLEFLMSVKVFHGPAVRYNTAKFVIECFIHFLWTGFLS